MSSFVRCVLGDLPATPALGRCDAHEHVVLGGPFITSQYPDFDLADLDASVRELGGYKQAGGGWIIDAMPTCCSRLPSSLAEVSRRSGVPIVMSTGRHLAQYYPADDPHVTLDREALRELMIREITDGVEGYRCGVIKVAGSAGRLSGREREAFIAAAQAHQATGCPILTHTEADSEGAWDQVNTLIDHGALPSKIILSHLDKNPDVSLHREVLQAGVRLEYDQHFRRLKRNDAGEPGPFELIASMAEAYPESLVLGMDLARRSYWTERGGEPGLAWLLTGLPAGLAQVGLSQTLIDRMLIDNAVNAFSFLHDEHSPPPLAPSHTTENETHA